jgi:hypothetical protein
MFHHATLQHHYAIIYIVWMPSTKLQSSFLFFMLETIFHWESKNLRLCPFCSKGSIWFYHISLRIKKLKVMPFLFKRIHLVFFLRGLKGHELFMDKMVSNGIQRSMPSRCGHIYVLSCALLMDSTFYHTTFQVYWNRQCYNCYWLRLIVQLWVLNMSRAAKTFLTFKL